ASYTATATYSDGSTKEVTAQATWSVSPSTYAAVAAGKLTTKEVSSNQTITITASYTEGGVSKQTTKSATIVDVPATLTSLSISGPDRVNEKSSASYTATATYSDGSTKEVTAQATWSVSPSTYATIASGKLTTSGNLFTSQTVTITANYTEGGITKQANKTVTISVISVSYQFIPDTGQTQFYTDTLGEDSDYLINPPSYTKLDARGNPLPDSASSWSMVKDNVTGLIWEVKTDDGSIHDKDNTYTWQDAQDKFIAKLNAEKFGGYSDWRLPTVKELSMIVDSGRFDPAINTNYFPNTKSSPYWSSTSSVYSTDTACYVNFKDGYVFIYSFKTSLRYVRAVRGNSAFSTFVVNGDGTVTDTSTSLMWQQDTAGPMNWEEAINYCENLSLGGYTDWRLPNRNELQSLLDYNHFSPAIDATVFPNTANTAYWSSTTYAGDPECAWLVDFYQGNVFGPYRYNKSDKVYYVRAVREGGNILIRSEVIITFNMELTSNVNDLKSAITLARDGVDFRPLDEDDTAVIKGDTLILTVSPPLTGRKNSIRIAANALKDLNDNVVSEAITIDNLAGELEGEEEKEVPSLTGVSVSGPDKVNENSTANYTAKALFSDGTTQDVTSTAQWSVSPSTYAAVAAGKLTTREVPSSQIITITASYSEGGVSKQATKSVTIVDVPAILTSLSISGQDKVNEKSSASYSATAAYSDGSTKEVTAQATWSVSPSTYAALAAGKLTTKEVSSNQTITITASYSEGGVSKQATKNVTIVDIQPGGSTSSKCQEDDSGSLDIIGTSGKVGDEVQIAVRVQNVPAAVYSFGFELTYDPDVLEYQGYEAGDLTSSFLILSAAAVGSGRIRAGGLGDKYLARGASGKVIVLKFKVKGGQNGNCYPLRLEKLTDDISTFSTSGGYFCLKTCSGDLNEDGKITPSDALIVFKCYLGTGSCSERADVDGNGEVTPADALCLFRKYLGQPSCLD
ncbi:MAG: DUF1566 domain-containing protein, partial [bacterium]|nr:DUF1566 domain-containing protein [bacterium]